MSEFLRLAYRKLGLPMEGHDIGTMRYIDLPAEALFALCELHLNSVNQQLYKDRPRRPEKLTPEFRKADEAMVQRHPIELLSPVPRLALAR